MFPPESRSGHWLLAACVLAAAACSPLGVIDRPSANQNSRINYLVIHFTSEDFAESLRLLTERTEIPVSAHYLIPEPGDETYARRRLRIFRLVPESRRAWHAGDSYWDGETALNNRSIGIELVNRSACAEPDPSGETPPEEQSCEFLPFDGEQIDRLALLAADILARNPDIDPPDVVGHADVAPRRRADPGPLFPWRRLHEHGIGAWYDEATVSRYRARFERCLPGIAHVERALAAWGYGVGDNGENDLPTRYAVRAFQMHFRPSDYSGRVDAETAAILFALVEKYRPERSAALAVGCAGP